MISPSKKNNEVNNISNLFSPLFFLKKIKLILNGNPSFCLLMKISQNLHMNDIEDLIKDKWKKKIKRFRLFSAEGVELFEDDVPFLKPGRTFYVSRGCYNLYHLEISYNRRRVRPIFLLFRVCPCGKIRRRRFW